MSVLVEALSLVIPRIVLDVSYPGGSDAFLLAMCEPACPARRVCADDTLASVSFLSPNDALAVEKSLADAGLDSVDDAHFLDWAYVDQRHGPTMPCDWLAWKRHPDGFTYAWLAGKEPGDMAAPVDWTPEQSRALVRSDIRDEPGRMMKLADENGIETWLDFNTGLVNAGLAHRDPATPEVALPDDSTREAPGAPSPLLLAVAAALDEHSLRYMDAGDGNVALSISGVALYSCFIVANEPTQQVICFLAFASRIPAHRRHAVAEALARANYTLRIGCLDLDFSDGEVRFRIGIDVEGGVLVPTMVGNMIGAAMHGCDRYHDAIMRVGFGEVEPEQAIADANAE